MISPTRQLELDRLCAPGIKIRDNNSPSLAKLTREELQHQPADCHRRLIHHLAAKGNAGGFAHILTDEDYLQPVRKGDICYPARTIHLIAGWLFPTAKFPYHLLTDELLDETTGDHTHLLAHLANPRALNGIDERAPDQMPILRINPSILTAKRLSGYNKFLGSPLGSILNLGKPGIDLIKRSRVLETIDPKVLITPHSNNPNSCLLQDVLRENACQLLPPAKLKDHADAAYEIAHKWLIRFKKSQDPKHKVVADNIQIWIAGIAQIRLAQTP